MSKYYQVIAGAVAGSDSAQSRRSIYEKARRLQLTQLRNSTPPLTSSEIDRERSALEEAIQRVEHEVTSSLNAVRKHALDRPTFAAPSSKPKTRRLFSALMLGTIMLGAILLAWLVLVPTPTTSELDADLDQVRNDIKQASMEADKYAPSLVKSLIETRKQTLLNAEAMLSQKKASILRRINLNFDVDGTVLHPASETELTAIRGEIGEAEQKLAESFKRANQYTGGLVQAMALATVETDELTLSQLRLKFYSAKYGLPFFFPKTPGGAKQPAPVPGNVVNDRDAL